MSSSEGQSQGQSQGQGRSQGQERPKAKAKVKAKAKAKATAKGVSKKTTKYDNTRKAFFDNAAKNGLDSNAARNAWLESTERKNAIASMPSPERRQRKFVKPPPADDVN